MLLNEATVQDIHTELIRRHWPDVAKDLQAHRHLWIAAMADRIGHGQLRKLRSLPHNIWNADDLFIITADSEATEILTDIGENVWKAFVHVFDDDSTEDLLGDCDYEGRLIVVSWIEDFIEYRETEAYFPMLLDKKFSLRDATAQDVQFALIQRELPRLAADLLEIQHLWEAVLLDRIADSELIKLRDIELNRWIADTVCFLGKDKDSAAQLVDMAGQWFVDEVDLVETEDAMELLGMDEESFGEDRVVIMWWDDSYRLKN